MARKANEGQRDCGFGKRKFYKTTITITVLSEDEPVSDDTDDFLIDLAWQIKEGDWSGKVEVTSTKELTAKQAAQALKRQGSDPEFFCLDDDGCEIEI